MNATEPLLLSALEGGVLRLTLNRPRQRNALSSVLMAELQAALDGAPAEARVIVIAANGPVFSSGHDLKEMSGCRADADKGQAGPGHGGGLPVGRQLRLGGGVCQRLLRHPGR